MSQSASRSRPRIVIVGAGFGGLFAAQALKRTPADVTLIDRHNYHLFQPLLYQVAAAALPPSDIAWPIRSILSRQRNATVLLDEVTGVDTAKGEVLARHRSVGFDYLVLATGATHAYFGHPEWAPTAPGLKSIDDATAIRRRILMAFEKAEMAADEAERTCQLRFVIVGGGPTGVELAGTLAELANHTLAKDFRRIDPRGAHVLLVEAGHDVLPAFGLDSRRYARRALEHLGVEVRVGDPVTHCDEHGVVVAGKAIQAATVIWAAGVAASPVGRWLGVETTRSGQVAVTPDLSVPGLPNVFVIGDAAAVERPGGGFVPGIAPAAKQQGRYVAAVIDHRLGGGNPPPAFRYRHAGNLATIGRQAAVIEFPRFRFEGWMAWWIWGIAHIYFLVGVPSPLLVSLRWLWEYLTYGRGARLITGAIDADRQGPAGAERRSSSGAERQNSTGAARQSSGPAEQRSSIGAERKVNMADDDVTTERLRLGILASGAGTTLQAVIDACETGVLPAAVAVVISNNSGSGALERAARHGIASVHLSARTHPDPAALDEAITGALAEHDVDLVLLAGYMKKLGPRILTAFAGRVINTHPALLPKHGGRGMYGNYVHEAVLAAGDPTTGICVHLVDGDYDTGRVLASREVAVEAGDDISSLARRVQSVERPFLVEVLKRIAVGEIRLEPPGL